MRFVRMHNVTVQGTYYTAFLLHHVHGARATMVDCFNPHSWHGHTFWTIASQATYMTSPSFQRVVDGVWQ